MLFLGTLFYTCVSYQVLIQILPGVWAILRKLLGDLPGSSGLKKIYYGLINLVLLYIPFTLAMLVLMLAIGVEGLREGGIGA